MAVTYIIKILAYGFPALLIVLGFIAYTGGQMADIIFGSGGDMVVMGVGLIIVGIMIFFIELFFLR